MHSFPCEEKQCVGDSLPIAFPGSSVYLTTCVVLPGKAPPREGDTDQLRTTAGARGPFAQSSGRGGGVDRGREGGFWGEDSRLSTGSEKRNKGCIGAGGEQTAQIITLSLGMEG